MIGISAIGFHSFAEPVAMNRSPAVSFIAVLVKEPFHLLQGAFYLTSSVIEFSAGLLKKEALRGADKVKRALEWFYRKLTSYASLHSTMVLGGGICELLLGLNQFNVIRLGGAEPLLAGLGGGCFIVAYLLVFMRYVKLYIQACRYKPQTDEEQEALRGLKNSCILAIISSLNSLIGIALALFGAASALVILFACVGAAAWGIKLLYDLARPAGILSQS